MNLYMIFQTTLKILLETFCKIQEILYLPEESRKEQQILQLILALFNHAMIMKIHMDGHIKSMSEIFMAYNLTSNHRPSEVIYNALVRIEAHQILTANKKMMKDLLNFTNQSKRTYPIPSSHLNKYEITMVTTKHF